MNRANTREGNFSRSGQLIQCLRREFLYSEKRPRNFVFRAIEMILSGETEVTVPIMLSRLTREAANLGSTEALLNGFAFPSWDTAARAVVNSMLGAGVLLDGSGAAIRPGITAQATMVAALEAGFRDLTEAYLLEFLIRRVGDVSVRDHTALADALFRQFDPSIPAHDLADRVVVLLARLAGRVELRDDGSYVARPQYTAG